MLLRIVTGHDCIMFKSSWCLKNFDMRFYSDSQSCSSVGRLQKEDDLISMCNSVCNVHIPLIQSSSSFYVMHQQDATDVN